MLVQEVQKRYGHASIDCCNERCKVHVDTGKNFVILKGELLVRMQPERMCDCMIFQDDRKIVIVELKGASLNAGKIIDKFTNSGKKAADMAESCKSGSVSLFMVLLAKSYKNHSAYDRIRRSKIKVHKQKITILTKRCGASLAEIVAYSVEQKFLRISECIQAHILIIMLMNLWSTL